MGLSLKAFLSLLSYPWVLRHLAFLSFQIPRYLHFLYSTLFSHKFYLSSSLSSQTLLNAANNNQHVQNIQAQETCSLPFKFPYMRFTNCFPTVCTKDLQVSSLQHQFPCCLTAGPILDMCCGSPSLEGTNFCVR